MDKVEQAIKAFREEMEFCWLAGIDVPAHVVMSRERLVRFVEFGVPYLIDKERTMLENKLAAMRNARRRHLH